MGTEDNSALGSHWARLQRPVTPGELLRGCLLGLLGGALVGFTAALVRPQPRGPAHLG